jgi:hypothetical protein
MSNIKLAYDRFKTEQVKLRTLLNDECATLQERDAKSINVVLVDAIKRVNKSLDRLRQQEADTSIDDIVHAIEEQTTRLVEASQYILHDESDEDSIF